MVGQAQIRRRLSQPEGVDRVHRILSDCPDIHRTELADRLCREMGFVDPGGREQRVGCLKALRVLESRGRVTLPPPRTATGPGRPRRLESGVPFPEQVPATVGVVRRLELVRVESEEQRLLWNTMFVDEHPRGAGPLVGRQVHYLIGSDHGWLGGMAFASAAFHLDDRDRWIGWDLETRQAHLDRIVGMSRFLIRPSVRCQNLASRVLSMAMVRMPQDFEDRYGYQPLLVETFVDTSQFSGTCYQAANWIRVGSSQGRGRQDRERSGTETVKDIYVYVLAQEFRSRLGVPVHGGRGPLPLAAGLEADAWTEQEFGGAPLGDERLSRRLVQSAAVMAENPTLSFPGASGGDKALVKGHYRLIDHPDESAVNMENILLPHRQQTIRRMKDHKTVLCIQDGSSLDYNGSAECEGLGVIGANQTGAKSLGLQMHSILAVTQEGLPLGVVSCECEAPVSRSKADSRATCDIPIEEKETYTWIRGMRDCESVAVEMPHTNIVQVMDREGDFLELFHQWRQGPRRTHLLVRANHNRRTTGDLNLFDGVRAMEPGLRVQIQIGRQSARPKKSKQKARPRRPARDVNMTLRYQQVTVLPPRYHKDMEPVTLWVVHLAEEDPAPGKKPIEWFLLTTMEISSPEQAERLVDWYCLRWRIEDWHRVLKTGCGIEELRNETAERLKKLSAIYLVIAWRVMLMTLLAREAPDLPAEVIFTDLELEVLTAFANSRRDLKSPTNLKEAVNLVGRMGGHLGRTKDPPPGHQAIWIGYSQLVLMCAGYLLGQQDARATGPP